MLKKIKMVASLLLVVCLFLPLSQCTVPPSPNTQVTTTQEIHLYVVPEKVESHLRYLPAVLFVMPLVIVLINLRVKREKLRYEFVDVILGLMVLTLVLFHVFLAKLVLGGYLALLAASSYVVASIIETGKAINFSYKKRS